MRFRLALYNLLLVLLTVLLLPVALLIFVGKPRHREGLSERLGDAPLMPPGAVWVHAVSVGEVMAALPMLEELRTRLGPRPLVLSTVTVTGQRAARRVFPRADRIFHFPLDIPFCVSRSLRQVRPALVVTVETEIWPNFLGECRKVGVPVMVVNGRVSPRSFGRYRLLRWFFKPFFQSLSALLMQGGDDAERALALGARPESVKITGNVKYDRPPDLRTLPKGVESWGREGFLLVAGSTHAGEEDILLDALERSPARVRLALVPRHPERFGEVSSLLERRKVGFTRFSALSDGTPVTGRVLLVDAMGFLDSFYALGSAAFVGGSLVPTGGHNLLEPAKLGKPILTGPHLFNFQEISDALLRAGGAAVVPDGEALLRELLAWEGDPARARMVGEKGLKAAGEAGGASKKNAEEVMKILGGSVPGS